MNRVSTNFEQHIILDEAGDPMILEGAPSIAPALFGLNELRVEYDADTKALWTHMVPQGRPSFTPSMLADFERWQDLIQANFSAGDLRFLVLGSHAPGVFCYGGDLALFRQLAKSFTHHLGNATANTAVHFVEDHYWHLTAAGGGHLNRQTDARQLTTRSDLCQRPRWLARVLCTK